MRVPLAFFRWTMREYLDVITHARVARVSMAVAETARQRQRALFQRTDAMLNRLVLLVRQAKTHSLGYLTLAAVEWIQLIWLPDPFIALGECVRLQDGNDIDALLRVVRHAVVDSMLVDFHLPRHSAAFATASYLAYHVGELPDFDTGKQHVVGMSRVRFTCRSVPRNNADVRIVACLSVDTCRRLGWGSRSTCLHIYDDDASTTRKKTWYERIMLRRLEAELRRKCQC